MNVIAPVLALIVTTAALAGGVEPVEVKYPPYPDVWGRKLPVPEGEESLPYVYRAPDGDLLIDFSWRPGGLKSGAEREFRTLTFFSGQLRKVDLQEANRFDEAVRAGGPYKSAKVDHIVLADGDVVDFRAVVGVGARCTPNYGSTLFRQDPDKYADFHQRILGEAKIETSPLRLYERPRRHHIWQYCNIAGGKDHYFKHVDPMTGGLIPLQDGTFLVSAMGYVIRYRPDLTSPFIDRRRELFLVAADRIRMLDQAVYRRPGAAIQNANDAIRDYLIHLRKEAEQ